MERNEPPPSNHPEFFGYQMHDARVISIRREGNEVEIVLSDMYADNYAIYLAKHLKRPNPRADYPVRFIARDVKLFKSAISDSAGLLTWEDIRTNSYHWKVDWTYHQDARCQWIAELFPMWLRGRFTGNAFLMIDCGRVDVIDERRKALSAILGENWGALWSQLVDRNGPRMREWLWGDEIAHFIASH